AQLVRNLLALAQAGQARLLDGGNVHESILRTVFRLNEAESLRGIEPLNSTSAHGFSLAEIVNARATLNCVLSAFVPHQMSDEFSHRSGEQEYQVDRARVIP